MRALDLAIERAKGVTKLAVSIGVGQSVVSNWKSRGTEPDPKSCVRIERKWGVPRQSLRPNDWHDIWPELVQPGQQELPNV